MMVGRMDIIGTRRGEIFFARTSVMRRRTAGARSKRVGDSASIAHVGAKKISPAHMRRGGDVLRSGVNGARAGGPKCAAQAEVDFGNRIGYSSTMYMK